MSIRKLNLGCGTDIREGWINLDCARLPGVDIVHDLNEATLPFKSDIFDEIVCDDILEHIFRYDRVLRELHRILKPGGCLTIRVPHFSSFAAFTDPTHVRFFAVRTFDFFVRGNPRSYYYDFSFSSMEKRRIIFNKDRFKVHRILEHLVNASAQTQEWYDERVRLFPALNIEVVLIK